MSYEINYSHNELVLEPNEGFPDRINKRDTSETLTEAIDLACEVCLIHNAKYRGKFRPRMSVTVLSPRHELVAAFENDLFDYGDSYIPKQSNGAPARVLS